MKALITYLSLALIGLYSTAALSFELVVKPVTEKVYALVGDINQRTPENLGLNNTLGFVITSDGVVLVSTGGWDQAAALIEKTIQTVTDKPIKLAVTIGTQDHHWMGNSYFLQQGIPVLALQQTIDSQTQFQQQNQVRLADGIKQPLTAITPQVADQVIDATTYDFTLGDTIFSLRYVGGGHFPGDAVLWLPEEQVLFTGDFVFNQRMLGLHPNASFLRAWQASFQQLEALNPKHIIPGHGYPSDLAGARKDTGDYLDWLLSEVGTAVEEMEDMTDTISRLSADTRFDFLQYYEGWHGRNVNQAYLQLEAE